jgi:non-ribosomal peptide synthetase component F
MTNRWTCAEHGPIEPVHPSSRPGAHALARVLKVTRVPVWLPWPLPAGWLVTGTTYAGDDPRGGRASVVACSGPAPLGGVGELILVAEEPGVGLGARFADVPGPDPGAEIVRARAGARLTAAGWPTSLWEVPRDLDQPLDRAAWVGEAAGLWLWLVAWPETADLMVHDDLTLVDLRDTGHTLDLPYGALSPRLAPSA